MGGGSALSAGEGAARRAEDCGREWIYGVPAAKVGRGSAAVVKTRARPQPGDDGRAPTATGAADATAAAAIPSATASTHVRDSPGAGTGAQNSATVGNSGAALGGGARAPPFTTLPILKRRPRGDHRDSPSTPNADIESSSLPRNGGVGPAATGDTAAAPAASSAAAPTPHRLRRGGALPTRQ